MGKRSRESSSDQETEEVTYDMVLAQMKRIKKEADGLTRDETDLLVTAIRTAFSEIRPRPPDEDSRILDYWIEMGISGVQSLDPDTEAKHCHHDL